MSNFRANQKAFALVVSVFFFGGVFYFTWNETNILLKLLQVFYAVGLYFFVLFSFSLLTSFFVKHKEYFSKMNVFSYFSEYILKTSFVAIYVVAFTVINYQVMKSSDHVKGVAKEKCYNISSFHACYDFFQMAINSEVTQEGKDAFDYAFNQCQGGKEKFCSAFVWMVDSYENYQKYYRDEALEAALNHKVLLTNKALLTEEYTIALAMNGNFDEAIKVQKQLVKYAKKNENKFVVDKYSKRLKQWEDMRKPASKAQVKKK